MEDKNEGIYVSSEDDINKANQVLSFIGGGFSIEDVLCVIRNHESANLDDIVMTFFSDINMEEWRNKDKILQSIIQQEEEKEEEEERVVSATYEEIEEAISEIDNRQDEEVMQNNSQSPLTNSSFSNIFEDPITFEIMVNAVTTSCGHSFSEKSIRDWLTHSSTCPVCNTPLNMSSIVPNYSLRQAITAISAIALRSNSPSPLQSSGDKPSKKNKAEDNKKIKSSNASSTSSASSLSSDPNLSDFIIIQDDSKPKTQENNFILCSDDDGDDEKINNNYLNESKIDNERSEDGDNIEDTKDEEADDEGEITLTKSSRMIPIIQEKINALYELDDLSDEPKVKQIHSELMKYKKKLEEHIEHHLVFNDEAEEINSLIDTFEQVEQVEKNTEVQLRQSGIQISLSSRENEGEELKEEKKEEPEEELRLSENDLTNSNFFLRSSGKNFEVDENEMQYLQGPQKITKDDLYAAKKILAIIGGGKYTLDDVVLVIRHNHLLKPIEIIEIFLNGVDIEEYRRKDKDVLRLSAPMGECPLCFDEFPITDLFTLNCQDTHRFCFECIQRMIDMNVNEGSLPYCPHQDIVNGVKKNCSYVISEREVSQIIYRSELPPTDKRNLIEKYKKILLRIGLMSMKGCMGCPTPGCENWLVVDDEIDPITGKRLKMQCPCQSCGKSFCSLCREIYHFHIDCDELREIKVQWIQWNTQDRSGVDKQLEDLAMQQRKADIAKRMEEFLADENWKENNLRLCPTCKNPIERVSGCDSMICGQNYHGGDVQRGCGAHFNWQTAEKYKSSFEREHLLSLNENLKIDKDDLDRIKADHGEFNICDVCNQRIVGFRFICVNCPCFNLCETCEPVMDHNPNHIFKILIKPETYVEEEIIIPEPPHPPNPPPVIPPLSAVPLIQLPVVLNLDHQTNWVPPPTPPKQSKMDKLRRWFGRNRREDL